MSLLHKLYRGLLASRVRLILLLSFSISLLVYIYSCSLGLSSNCVSQSRASRFERIFISKFDHQELKRERATTPQSDIIPKGGMYFRSTPMNKTQVEQYVSEVVERLQQNAQIERIEREKLKEQQQKIVERQKSENLENIDLDNWNLDAFYHMPRKLVPQQKNHIPVNMELKRKVEMSDTFQEVHLKQNPNQLSNLAPKSDQQAAMSEDNQADRELASMDMEDASGPEEVEQEVKEEVRVKPPVENRVHMKKKVYIDQSNLLPYQLQPQGVSKKSKRKAKAKKKKVVTFLPDSFPYFVSKNPTATYFGHTCSNGLCSEYLSEGDKTFYKYCVSRMKQKDQYKDTEHAPGDCHFMNGTSRAAVALASFPGSGNTWVRGLLEKATGVCTGSIYCDNSLRVGGMNGEGVRSGAVIAVKTHKSIPVTWTPEDQPRMVNDNSPTSGKNPAYGSAILIVRNPFNALVAEWNRLTSTEHIHVGEADKSKFGDNANWYRFIKQKLPVWQAYFKYWVVGAGTNHRTLVVRFEHLKTDTVGTVIRMLDFLRLPYKTEEVTRRLTEDFGKFKRKHTEEFEHFTEEQKSIIRSAITKSVTYLQENNNGNTFGIEEFLMS